VPTESGEAINLRDGDSSVLARRALKRLHCRVHKAGHHLVKLDTAGRHGARIGTKKLRYAAEFFSTTFGRGEDKRHSHYIATLATLQSALGDLNDLAMIQKCACAVAGRSMELAFHAGQIIGNQKAEQTRLLVKSVHAYRHWREAKPFWH
jgi:CHAD domain-containing protein